MMENALKSQILPYERKIANRTYVIARYTTGYFSGLYYIAQRFANGNIIEGGIDPDKLTFSPPTIHEKFVTPHDALKRLCEINAK